jgi:hypothetical protein
MLLCNMILLFFYMILTLRKAEGFAMHYIVVTFLFLPCEANWDWISMVEMNYIRAVLIHFELTVS